ncbi:MAG: TonB-dependent siderophore receptor [Alcanivorax sp.]|nr:TonB-dependent siderophore receptor [Alcanivorax sp.]
MPFSPLRPLALSVPLLLPLALAGLPLAAVPVPALAQNATEGTTESAALVDFQVAPGPLSRCLNRFADQAGLYLSAAGELTAGKRCVGLRGRYAPRQGLAELLAGTGLMARFADDRTATLYDAGQANALDSVSVTAASAGSVIGPDRGYQAAHSLVATKTRVPLSETPRSVSVVTRERLEDQGSQTLTDALGYVPGIFAPPLAAGDGLAGDFFFIRGFNATDYGYGLFRDGLRVQPNRYDTTTEPYGLERVEVFRGPSSILYGENAPGGLVNLVSKRPTHEARGEVRATYGSYDRRQLGVDVSGPLVDDKVLGRLVMLGREADTQTDHMPDDRVYLAPSLTLRLSEDDTLTLLSSYQKDTTKLELGLPAAGTLLDNPNGELDRSTLIGHPDWDHFEREVWSLGYEYQHWFNDAWQFRQNARYLESRVSRHEIWWQPLDDGGYGTRVNTAAYDRRNRAYSFSVDNQLEGQLRAGDLEQTLLFGLGHDRSHWSQLWYAGMGETIDVFDPQWSAEPATPLLQQDAVTRQAMTGLYGQWHGRYDHWIVLLGGRYDTVDSEYEDAVSGADLDTDDEAFTWQSGLMYQFDNGVSPYLSYATSFVPVQQLSSTQGSLDPITGEQVEAGIKIAPPGSRTELALSVYDLRKEDDVIFDGTLGDYRQVGESRSEGVEVELTSALSERLRVTASYSHTNARITEDAPGSLQEDQQMVYVPKDQASAWAHYRFTDGDLAGLRLGGGLRYIGETYAYSSLYGELETDAVVLADLALGYRFSGGWALDLNVRNLFDKEYFTACNNAGRCYFGQERTLQGSVSYRW